MRVLVTIKSYSVNVGEDDDENDDYTTTATAVVFAIA